MSHGFSLAGRVLVLTESTEQLHGQLRGVAPCLDLASLGPLRDRVSTDEITPAWACYYFDRTLARYCLVGLEGGAIQAGDVVSGGFEVLVAGSSFGYGSSRETAPFALREAGIRLIIVKSVEKIFLQNCQNLGVHVSTDLGLLPRLLAGESAGVEELCRGADVLAREVVLAGGLFAYNARRLSLQVPRKLTVVRPDQEARPMTLVERIIASRVANADGSLGVFAVAPGESHFVRADLRFSHDYVTAMADALFRAGLGEDAQVNDPGSLVLFRDHLTLLGQALTPRHHALNLYEHALELARAQERFAKRHGVRLYDEVESESGPRSYGICHNVVVDELGVPGTVIVGTDSHTCTAGALGAFAFGVGSTDMANAFFTRDVRVCVPETVKVELSGQLRAGTSAKDVMLSLLSLEATQAGALSGKVLEFCGSGVQGLSLDERATLTNMAVEASAVSGIVAFDERARDELSVRRGQVIPPDWAFLHADPGASYAAVLKLDLSQVEPMLALPGDPRNAQPLRGVLAAGAPRIDIAYGGSCTGSKAADIDAYAAVLAEGLRAGRPVAPHVRHNIKQGSLRISPYSAPRG